MTLSETILRAREKARLSVRELAKLSGVSPASISRVENGDWNITIQLARALTKALRLPIHIWFCEDIGTPDSISLAPLADCDEAIVVRGGR